MYNPIIRSKNRKFYEDCSKSSKPHTERRVTTEHFCCGSILSLLLKLEKLIQISIEISEQISYKVEICTTDLKPG